MPCKEHFTCPVLWLQPEACDLRGHMLKDKVGIWEALQFILRTSAHEIYWNLCVTVARIFVNIIGNPLHIMWGLLRLLYVWVYFNPLNPELNPICYLLALLGAHHFLHVSRIRVKLLTLRWLMSYIYIYGAPVLDVSRSRTTTQHSR